MAVEFFVTLHKGQWQVVFGGQVFGPFATQGYAVRAAVRAVAGAQGSTSRILAQASCVSPASDAEAVPELASAKTN